MPKPKEPNAPETPFQLHLVGGGAVVDLPRYVPPAAETPVGSIESETARMATVTRLPERIRADTEAAGNQAEKDIIEHQNQISAITAALDEAFVEKFGHSTEKDRSIYELKQGMVMLSMLAHNRAHNIENTVLAMTTFWGEYGEDQQRAMSMRSYDGITMLKSAFDNRHPVETEERGGIMTDAMANHQQFTEDICSTPAWGDEDLAALLRDLIDEAYELARALVAPRGLRDTKFEGVIGLTEHNTIKAMLTRLQNEVLAQGAGLVQRGRRTPEQTKRAISNLRNQSWRKWQDTVGPGTPPYKPSG